MNIFRNKQKAAPAPVCIEQSPLDLAEAAVQAADARLSRLHSEFLEFRQKHRLLVDANYNIIQPMGVDATTRGEVARRLHEHRIARGVALHQFHTALGEWAKVKSVP